MTKDENWLLEEKYGGAESPAYEADKARISAGEPVAYVIGWQPYLGLKIYLDSHPLIPRPETEWWVEQLVKEKEIGTSRHSQKWARSGPLGQVLPPLLAVPVRLARFLDLCAGSGAIGCALLREFPQAHISFGEIDPAHEATIHKNIRENGLDESRATIGIGDLFAPFAGQQFDLIVANPPYIPEGRELPASVAEYEPSLALRSGTDGLELIRRIATELRMYLAPGGEAWIECDIHNIEEAKELFTAQGYTAEILKDQYGAPRTLVVS